MPLSYPVSADLFQKLTAAGFVDNTGAEFAFLDLAAKIQAAAEAWEQQVEWLPFLSPGTVQTRVFDPPGPPARRGDSFSSLRGGGGRLFFGAGLLALSSVAVAGAEYLPSRQFVLRPDNAPLKGKPYTWIEFLVPPLARMSDIAVTGVWGYSLSCPAQAWTAILAYAAALCVPELAILISGGLYKIDDVQFSGSGLSPLSAEHALWMRQFAQAAEDLRRPQWF